MKLKLVGALVLLAAGMALAEPPAPIYGDYVEARSNHVYTCGCLYSGEMVTDGREAIVVWSFERGSYRGAVLDGVKALAVLLGEGTLSLPGPRRAAFYVDGAPSEAQRRAVIELLAERYPAAIGEIVAVRSAPIAFRKDAEGVRVRIPDVVEVHVRKARLPEDAHYGSVLWYEPFIALADSTMAMTLLYEYRGNDFARQWWRLEPGITGYFGRFTL